MKLTHTLLFSLFPIFLVAQHIQVKIQVFSPENIPLAAELIIPGQVERITAGPEQPISILLPPGEQSSWMVFSEGFIPKQYDPGILTQDTLLSLTLFKDERTLEGTVITGNWDEITRSESPIPVETYSLQYFRKSASPNLFEAVQMINGVRPQVNCNICNTGDIHLNGMEGPYTMVTIDGMPLFSGLSTVYGLMGIPLGIIERVEIIKGPASALYGSEAMAGNVNVITKKTGTAPRFYAEYHLSSYLENTLELAGKINAGKNSFLIGASYFNLPIRWDVNKDGFTDIPLQNRLAGFVKWTFDRKNHRELSIAARYIIEDRWGGQLAWNRDFRGSDSIYGENIITNRIELFGQYRLPGTEKIMLQWGYFYHHQDSWYGKITYLGRQHGGFTQLYWQKKIKSKLQLISGLALRIDHYDDNSIATEDSLQNNRPQSIILPGVFVQLEAGLHPRHKLVTGLRYDHSFLHGPVFTPRINYKWKIKSDHSLGLGSGMGFRVVNIFTEEHAALTGSRQVKIEGDIAPERSINGYIQYLGQIQIPHGFIELDLSGFYTYFFQKIVPDYETDPDLIIYKNLNGHSTSRGIAANINLQLDMGWVIQAGASWMDVFQETDHQYFRQLFAPEWSGNLNIGYAIGKTGIKLDLTGQWYGPMRLPILPNDFRPEYSPWYAILNLQVSKTFKKGWEIYGGGKNLLNFIPSHPLMRPEDPFDKYADDPVTNPNGYTFDTAYNFSPLMGIRAYAGLRYTLK